MCECVCGEWKGAIWLRIASLEVQGRWVDVIRGVPAWPGEARWSQFITLEERFGKIRRNWMECQLSIVVKSFTVMSLDEGGS